MSPALVENQHPRKEEVPLDKVIVEHHKERVVVKPMVLFQGH